eukprot:2049281-Rhodomonas_salina.1
MTTHLNMPHGTYKRLRERRNIGGGFTSSRNLEVLYSFCQLFGILHPCDFDLGCVFFSGNHRHVYPDPGGGTRVPGYPGVGRTTVPGTFVKRLCDQFGYPGTLGTNLGASYRGGQTKFVFGSHGLPMVAHGCPWLLHDYYY